MIGLGSSNSIRSEACPCWHTCRSVMRCKSSSVFMISWNWLSMTIHGLSSSQRLCSMMLPLTLTQGLRSTIATLRILTSRLPQLTLMHRVESFRSWSERILLQPKTSTITPCFMLASNPSWAWWLRKSRDASASSGVATGTCEILIRSTRLRTWRVSHTICTLGTRRICWKACYRKTSRWCWWTRSCANSKKTEKMVAQFNTNRTLANP